MIALSKMADHGVTVAVALAQAELAPNHNVKTNVTAADLALVTALPLPTVAKILKQLSHGGVVTSLRGVKGGYRLAEPPQQITVWQIMVAIDGDFSLTECSSHPNSAGQSPHECSRSPICQIRPQWQKIDEVITAALKKISLYEMIPLPQRLMIEPLPALHHRVAPHNIIQSGLPS
ncbi:MAG: SUF system Fe-S cluster assembly regulator [Candidatus Pacebacteria bacterium]|nr:SUF system Fe-S cluster assembly regulator [Candidatus Paceibacterota bacterium]